MINRVLPVFLGMLLAFICAACKSVEKSSGSSSISATTTDEVCCAFSHDNGVYFDTASCRSGDGRDCCERGRLPVILTNKRYLSHHPGSCDALAAQRRTSVQICRGPTRFAEEGGPVGGISDFVTGISKMAHVWIKTANVEVGMGSKRTVDDSSPESFAEKMGDFMSGRMLRDKVSVEWRDHTGFSRIPGAKCDELSFCDEQCVESQLQIGAPLGVYSVVNQCHLAAVKVLRRCGCYNHCVAWGPGGVCLKRIFPELRGFNLNDDDQFPG